jgi:hypothetical protein
MKLLYITPMSFFCIVQYGKDFEKRVYSEEQCFYSQSFLLTISRSLYEQERINK